MRNQRLDKQKCLLNQLFLFVFAPYCLGGPKLDWHPLQTPIFDQLLDSGIWINQSIIPVCLCILLPLWPIGGLTHFANYFLSLINFGAFSFKGSFSLALKLRVHFQRSHPPPLQFAPLQTFTFMRPLCKQQSNEKYNFMQQQMGFPILSMQTRFMNSGPQKNVQTLVVEKRLVDNSTLKSFSSPLFRCNATPKMKLSRIFEKNQVDVFFSLLGLIKEVSRLLWRWKLYFWENFDNNLLLEMVPLLFLQVVCSCCCRCARHFSRISTFSSSSGPPSWSFSHQGNLVILPRNVEYASTQHTFDFFHGHVNKY